MFSIAALSDRCSAVGIFTVHRHWSTIATTPDGGNGIPDLEKAPGA
jgi:hypothetical protein